MTDTKPTDRPALRHATQTMRAVFHNTHAESNEAWVMRLGGDGALQYVGSALARRLGAARSEWVGKPLLECVAEADRPATTAAIARLAETRAPQTLELRIATRSGPTLWVEASMVGSETDDAILLDLRDISARKEREAALRKEATWFQSLTRYSEDAIIVFDTDSTCLFVSGSVETVLGILPEAMSWQRFVDSVLAQDRLAVMQRIAAVARSPGATARVEYRSQHPNGVRFVRARFVNGVNDPALGAFLVYLHDVTTQRVRDLRTALPNRTFLIEHLRHLLSLGASEENRFALLLIRIEDFDSVLASLPDSASDELVFELATRLGHVVEAPAILTHLEAALFGVIRGGPDRMEAALELASKVKMALEPPIAIQDKRVHVQARIGIAASNVSLDTPAAILAAARAALHTAAGQDGRGRSAVYEPEMGDRMVQRFGFESDLREAVDREQFEVVFQPIVTLGNQELASFEALSRWSHAERGAVSPALFIPIAESLGLLPELGEWVLHTAAKWVAQTERQFGEPVTVAVNISPMQLTDPAFLERVDNVLRQTGVRPECLRLELTESAFIKQPGEAAKILRALKSRGFTLALDDFGTGYSSLSYLDQLPFDVLKIDRSFVTTLETAGPKRVALVRAIVWMAQCLGMKVVAEGVETEGQESILLDLGCDYVQGFRYGRGLGAKDATELVRASVEGHGRYKRAESAVRSRPGKP